MVKLEIVELLAQTANTTLSPILYPVQVRVSLPLLPDAVMTLIDADVLVGSFSVLVLWVALDRVQPVLKSLGEAIRLILGLAGRKYIPASVWRIAPEEMPLIRVAIS